MALSQRQVEQYMGAAGAILATEQTTEAVMATCGRLVPALRPRTRSANRIWQRRNKAMIDQARSVQQQVYDHLRAIGNRPAVRQFRLHIKRYTDSQVKTSVSKIKRMAVDERKYVCRQLITKIRAGKWDVQVTTPAAFHYLQTIKGK